MTLLPGDIVLTGTPAGVGPITDGDIVTVVIEGIGSLTNRVALGATLRDGLIPFGIFVGVRYSSVPALAAPMGYGVIGSPTDSGSVSLGSSPGTPATDAPMASVAGFCVTGHVAS